MEESKLLQALLKFRAFRQTLNPESRGILNAGLYGRLLAYLPEEKAIKAINDSIAAWENQGMVNPINREELYAQMQ